MGDGASFTKRMDLQRAFQRNIIVTPPETQWGAETQPGPWMRTLLQPFGLDSRGPVWVEEINLERSFVVVVNASNWAVDCTGMHLCNEENRNRFNFPPGFVLPPSGQVTVRMQNS